jgi:hypothetical protein
LFACLNLGVEDDVHGVWLSRVELGDLT